MEIYKEIVNNKDSTSYSFILFDKKIAIYYLSFHIKKDTCFIDKLDSTGKRAKYNSKDFVYTLLSEYCKDCQLFFCFSLSSQIYFFKNTSKKIIKNLTDFWEDIFRNFNGQIFILKSGSKNFLKDIFKSSADIPRFEDEPVSKIINKAGFIDLDKVYEILNCRSDFMKGALIYLVRDINNEEYSDLYNKKESDDLINKEDNINKEDTISDLINKEDNINKEDTISDLINKEDTIIDPINKKESADAINNEEDVSDVIKNLDFENIEKASQKLVEMLKLEPFNIKTYKRLKKQIPDEVTKILTVKRRK